MAHKRWLDGVVLLEETPTLPSVTINPFFLPGETEPSWRN